MAKESPLGIFLFVSEWVVTALLPYYYYYYFYYYYAHLLFLGTNFRLTPSYRSGEQVVKAGDFRVV